MKGMEPRQVLSIEDIPFRRTDPQEAEAAADTAPAVHPGTAEVVPASHVRTTQ